MKNILSIMSSFFLFSGCGVLPRGEEQTSKPQAIGISVSVDSNGNGSVGGSNPAEYKSGDLAFLVETGWQFNNYGTTPRIPQCGEPARMCADIDAVNNSNAHYECVKANAEVQRRNLEKGFYLERHSVHAACDRACVRTMPACSGVFGCTWDAITYSAKKLLEVTNLCHEGCVKAYIDGYFVPASCKNLNDDPALQQADRELEDAEKKAANNPAVVKRMKELAALEAEIQKINEEERRLKDAEAEMTRFLNDVYRPEMKAIETAILAFDGPAMEKSARDVAALKKASETIESVKNSLISSAPDASAFATYASNLDTVADVSCKQYDYSSETAFAAGVRSRVNSLHQNLLARARSLGSEEITAKYEAIAKQAAEQLTAFQVPDFLSGTSSELQTLCRTFRTVRLSVEIGRNIVVLNSSSRDLSRILEEINSTLTVTQNQKSKELLKQSFVSSVGTMVRALQSSRIQNRYSDAEALAVDSVRILHISIYTAIDLAEGFSPAERTSFKDELSGLLSGEVNAWNSHKKRLGQNKIVIARASGLNSRLTVLRSRIEKLASSSVLAGRWKEIAGRFTLALSKSPYSIDIKVDADPQYYVQLDNELGILEATISDFTASELGVLK